MNFIRDTSGSYINLDHVAVIEPAQPGPHGTRRHEVRGADRKMLGYVESYLLPQRLYAAVLPADPLWRIIRAAQDDEGIWYAMPPIPVIAFVQTIDGTWEPLTADFHLDSDIGNPSVLCHAGDSRRVYDNANGTVHDNLESWLLDLAAKEEEEPIP